MLEGFLMSVKTLSPAQSMAIPATISHAPTYSVAPSPARYAEEQIAASPSQLDAFLEEENPLGTIRGVMWVMVFNTVVFVVGFAVWELLRLLK
jgi:hypothetical protein